MRFQRSVALPAILVTACVGCAYQTDGNPTASPIAVPTLEPAPPGTPQACPAALVEGQLVTDERWGIALGADGLVREVIWPHGYAAYSEGGRVSLIDEHGEVVADVGDRVEIGGGEVGNADAWIACGGISVVDEG